MAETYADAPVFFIDNLPYRAWKEPDLGWLKEYGTVFMVMDQHFSGNLLFGVQGKYGKLLVKYAGARTVYYRGRTEDAVYRLKNAMALYDRSHPALIRLLAHGQAGEGYAGIFEWREAHPLRPIPADSRVREQVRRLPFPCSLGMLDRIFDLHALLARDGIVAVGFSDENVLIDFGKNEALVYDIDLYRQKPVINDRGRMPGSSRFMAPEEYAIGAPLDETTTLYNMAALAFEFYGENEERKRETWIGPRPLYEVARRATMEKRADRYPSMRSFLDAWRDAVGQCRL